MPWQDLIDVYCTYTKNQQSPEIFRKWAAIAMVGGAVERRVWATIGSKPIYPNMWVLLVAPPGVGKGQAIDPVADLLRASGKFHLVPTSVNSASLMEAFQNAFQSRTISADTMIEYHSMFALPEEFGFFMPEYDHDFMSRMCAIYNNEPELSIQRVRFGLEPARIINPQLNFLGGTQPGFLSSLIPEAGWNMGFMSRFMMIYSASRTLGTLDPFGTKFQNMTSSPLRDRLIESLIRLSNLYGQAEWSQDAGDELISWYQAGGPPRPTHSKLVHYNSRRTDLFITKLALIATLARTGELRIELEDYCRARDWMIEAEILLPDIFRDMLGKSDKDLLQELHIFCLAYHEKSKQNGVHEKFIYGFLGDRMPSQNMPRLLDVAIRSGLITPAPGGFYIPRARYNTGGDIQ